MIYEIDTNLLEYSPLDGIIHQANCLGIFGGGIALHIKNKFPEAYEADCKTIAGDKSKLGTFSVAVLPSNFHIYNMYGQFNIGFGRMTNYEAVATGLSAIKNHAFNRGLKTLGLPKFMGCRLGGGDYRIVRAIIEVEFENSPLELYICNYGN
jgi:O-acetyl-ADP-ribose deacetylase (regulator of RNase III)